MFTSTTFDSNSKPPQQEPGLLSYILYRGQSFLPMYYFTMLFGVSKLFCAVYLTITGGLNQANFIGMILSAFVIYVSYSQVLRVRVLGLYLALMHTYYLNGFCLKRIFDVCTMRRLGVYLGHGLCFETSALMMMISKCNRSSRLVIADARSPKSFRRFRHAWIEVKMYGMYWVIDPSWGNIMVHPRFLYQLRVLPFCRRVVKHRDFWKTLVANTLYSAICTDYSSYVFWNLVAYRPLKSRSTMFNYERYGQKELLRNVIDFQTQVSRCKIGTMLYYSFEHVSITKEIIDRFVTDTSITRPCDDLIAGAEALSFSILDL